jgi:hypothetical protein
MKSELLATESKQSTPFPALYLSRSNHAVVLFTDNCAGVVVKANAFCDVGEFDDGYVDCNNTDNWIRLPAGSQVILTQE